MKRMIVFLELLCVSCLFVACDKWLTIQPENEIETTKLYETEDGFWQALNGVYSLFGENHGPAGGMQVRDVDFLAGVWSAGTQSVEYRLQHHEYKEGDVDERLGNLFLGQYKIVAHVNTLLSYLDKVDFLPQESYNLLKGEALALRAWSHFDIVRLWGPMPANVDEQYRYLPYVKKTSKKVNVYDTYEDYMKNLITDLDSAELLLGQSEPLLKYSCAALNVNGGLKELDRLEYYWRQHRFNFYAVEALQARVALWMNNKERAVKYAMAVKDAQNPDGTAKFRLGTVADIDLVNTNTNGNTLKTETVFGYYEAYFNWYQVYSDAGGCVYRMNYSNLDRLFGDKNDFRYSLANWVIEKDYYTKAPLYATTYKYKCYNDIWIPKIRLAEMYLILMECSSLEVANKLYEEFCTSRGVRYVAMTENNKMSSIMNEYYKEFLAEGQIFYMNKRLGITKMLWCNEKCYESQYVLPIPQRESEIFN